MRVVIWQDETGLLHRSWVRDQDPDAFARSGVPADPPDVTALDWDAIARELHNELVRRHLVTWADVQAQQQGLTGAVLAVLKPKLVQLYRQQHGGMK